MLFLSGFPARRSLSVAFLGTGSFVEAVEAGPLSKAANGDHWPGGVLDSGSEASLKYFSIIKSFKWRSLTFLVLAIRVQQCGHFWGM